jgi:hypothetical protein
MNTDKTRTCAAKLRYDAVVGSANSTGHQHYRKCEDWRQTKTINKNETMADNRWEGWCRGMEGVI